MNMGSGRMMVGLPPMAVVPQLSVPARMVVEVVQLLEELEIARVPVPSLIKPPVGTLTAPFMVTVVPRFNVWALLEKVTGPEITVELLAVASPKVTESEVTATLILAGRVLVEPPIVPSSPVPESVRVVAGTLGVPSALFERIYSFPLLTFTPPKVVLLPASSTVPLLTFIVMPP